MAVWVVAAGPQRVRARGVDVGVDYPPSALGLAVQLDPESLVRLHVAQGRAALAERSQGLGEPELLAAVRQGDGQQV